MRHGKERIAARLAAACLALWGPLLPGSGARAEPALPATLAGWTNAAASATDAVPIVVRADLLTYDRRAGWIEASGNLRVTRGEDALSADGGRVDLVTGDAVVTGNVHMSVADGRWNGDRLDWNLNTGAGKMGGVDGFWPPLNVMAADASRGTNGVYAFRGVLLSTCEEDCSRWHYHVRARELTLRPDEGFTARRVVWYFGRVPVLWLPRLDQDMRGERGFRFRVGHDTRQGTFLLGSYGRPLGSRAATRTLVDYRSRRGFGFGESCEWTSPGDRGKGECLLYTAKDRDPGAGSGGAVLAPGAERYRGLLRLDQAVSARDTLLLNADYVSDAAIREDFFEDEYRASRDPDNHAALVHRGDVYTASLLLSSRLNDFYTGVNRLPELSVDFLRTPLGESTLEYEGRSSVAYLEKSWAASESNKEDYAALRVDSLNMVYRPSRWFGFLSVVPRAGGRATWYSQTRQPVPVVVMEPVEGTGGTNGPLVMAPATNWVDRAAPAAFRTLYELGTEVSFKAFRTWGEGEGGVRHVVEPYANYTFLPEPSVASDRLWQFDKVDGIGLQHDVRFGVRNKIQVKRGERPANIVDADVHTVYDLRPEKQGQTPDILGFKVLVTPTDVLRAQFDGKYSLQDSTLDVINSRVILSLDRWGEADVEQRLKPGKSDVWNGTFTLFPKAAWSLETTSRYEAQARQLEEQDVYVRRTFDCMVFRVGGGVIPARTAGDGSRSEDEWHATVEFWLRAFPKSGLRMGSEQWR